MKNKIFVYRLGFIICLDLCKQSFVETSLEKCGYMLMETIESVENFLYFHVSLNQACRQKGIVLPWYMINFSNREIEIVLHLIR